MPEAKDLNDMMLFLAVVEAGSFTLAAERTGMPKANLSRKVSRLEHQLGVTLLERSTRSQHLTEVGKQYLAHCRRIHQELDLANASVSQLIGTPKGQLRVGASVAIGQLMIQPKLADFMHQYPNIDMQLSLTNRRVDLIEEGFDMLIRVGDLDDSGLIAKRLGSAKRQIYASPNYLTQCKTIKTVSDLSTCNFLLMSKNHHTNSCRLQSGQKNHDIVIKPKLLVDDFFTLKHAVLDGLGIAVLPDYMCQTAVEKGQLVQVLPGWGMPNVNFYALYPQYRLKIPKVRVFLDFIQTVFSTTLLAH